MGVEFRRRNVPVPDQYCFLSQPKEKLNSHSQVEIGIVIPGLHRPGIAAGLSGEESPSL